MSAMATRNTPLHQDLVIAKEWQAVIDAAGHAVRRAVAEHVEHDIDDLTERYAARTETDPESARFLSSADSQKEAGYTVRRWLTELFCCEDVPLAERIAEQRASGEFLARIDYPMQAVSSGARKLRAWIISELASAALSPAQLLQAASYVGDLLDISVELRNAGAIRHAVRRTRIDEAYRMHSLGQNVATEGERQQAALTAWSHDVLLTLHRSLDARLPRLGNSDFGLWVGLRAKALFENAPQLARIAECVDRIDAELLPRFDVLGLHSDVLARTLIEQLQTELTHIKFYVNGLFERYVEVENGREALTRVFDRRITTTAPMREGGDRRVRASGVFAPGPAPVAAEHDTDDAGPVHQKAAVAGGAHGVARPSEMPFNFDASTSNQRSKSLYRSH